MLPILFFFAFLVVTLSFANIIPPDTVDSLDPQALMGRWYLMYSSLIPVSTYLNNGYCATADYHQLSVQKDKIMFRLVNSQRMGTPKGELDQVEGDAINYHPVLAPGKYIIKMDDTSVFVDGQLWIVYVGDKDSETGQYSWVLISSPFRLNLFVITPNVGRFNSELRAEALQKVRALGFNQFYNQPIEIFQSNSECNYAPQPEEEEEGQ